MKRFILRGERFKDNCVEYLRNLDIQKELLCVEIKPFVEKRSQAQNDFLHAVTLKILSDETGESIEDMKQYLLGEAFGWEVKKVHDREIHRPVKPHTSALTVKEFTWFIEWCESWASMTLGITIPRPGEDVTGLRT